MGVCEREGQGEVLICDTFLFACQLRTRMEALANNIFYTVLVKIKAIFVKDKRLDEKPFGQLACTF